MYDIPMSRAGDREREGPEAASIRAAQADPTAFSPLYLQYRDRVYAYLRTRTSGPEDAADLTQQVFLQALDALPRYRQRGAPFAAWLLRIARNAAINHHKRQRQDVAWDLLPESLHPSTDDDPETQAIRHDNAAWLQAVLGRCDDTAREMLALHFAAGLTVAETAAVVGKSEAAVKKQLSRTVRALKEHYHDPR
ncbi:MAG: sigma-70 family RNA polymerase sigma factor [Chloroflexi bacterium]|nr:sigma-70 family RNA polymerase sigma factor [Chloroflexota bacterium]